LIVQQSGRQHPTLHFRGLPRALDSLVSIPYHEVGPTPKISVDNLVSSHAFDAGGKASRLHLALSQNTPPGTYKGSAEVGGKSYPVEIQVEAYYHLALSPRQLILNAKAGEKMHADLILANSGNVACDIGKTYVFGLYDIHGAESGIGAAFRQTESTGERRADRLLDALAEGHGGMVRVQVEEGTGSIAPGDVRPLRLNLHFPSGLKSGHTYTGTLPIENLRYYVKVRAIGESK
jgi:hypothetical protein